MKLLIKNGKIYQERDTFTNALFIENGLITATGREALGHEHALRREEILDVQDKTVVPGFNDAHMHFYQAGLALETVQLHGVSSIEELISRGRAYLLDRPDFQGTLRGRGFHQDLFKEKRLPTKKDLDRISTEFPIVFTRTCSHLAVVNSRALSFLEENNLLHPVEGGSIMLGTDGQPNGIFQENAISLLDHLYEEPTVETVLRTLKNAAHIAHSYGLTSLQVNDIWGDSKESEIIEKAYMEFSKERALRIYHQIYIKSPEDFMRRIHDGFKKTDSPFNRYGALKLFADGSLGARTAFLREPYVDDPSTQGMMTLPKDILLEFLQLCEKNKIQAVIHVIGDGALEMVLSCFEKTAAPGNPLRHGLIHVQITDEALLKKIQSLQLCVYAQPIFLHSDHRTVALRVGKNLADTSYAFGTMEKLNIKVAYSSDAPIERFHVMENLYCAVTRKDLYGNPPEGFNKSEAVDRCQALDNITVSSAFMSSEEAKKGRLKEGYVADLVVLEDPYFDVPDEKIKDVRVFITMVDGTVVYSKESH
ncbi:amidohydrolase [Proteiniclasticum ruminis]|uniref:amidohydrolase n=1 Tax=Proteiniclasticum ruminis TaxID=398199 RepID=UPI00289B9102|nr:amidohydrolase [Proteiniclasticum ruminis]